MPCHFCFSENMRKVAHWPDCQFCHIHTFVFIYRYSICLGSYYQPILLVPLEGSDVSTSSILTLHAALTLVIHSEWHKESFCPLKTAALPSPLLCCWLKYCSIQPLHSVKCYVAAWTCLIAFNLLTEWTRITHGCTAHTQVQIRTHAETNGLYCSVMS